MNLLCELPLWLTVVNLPLCYSAAATAGILTPDTHATLTAAVIVSMLLSPLPHFNQARRERKSENESTNMTGLNYRKI